VTLKTSRNEPWFQASAAVVDEICALLGYYAASCGNWLPTFRYNVSVPSSRIKSPSRTITIRRREMSQKSADLVSKRVHASRLRLKLALIWIILSNRQSQSTYNFTPKHHPETPYNHKWCNVILWSWENSMLITQSLRERMNEWVICIYIMWLKHAVLFIWHLINYLLDKWQRYSQFFRAITKLDIRKNDKKPECFYITLYKTGSILCSVSLLETEERWSVYVCVCLWHSSSVTVSACLTVAITSKG
jgi:hypothetical protein